MADHGADWCKREPQAYLGGVVGKTARQHAVYSVTLGLIYAYGGRCIAVTADTQAFADAYLAAMVAGRR